MRHVLLSFLCSAAVGTALADGMPARLVFVVKDDVDRPVHGASVRGWFGDATNEGAHDRFQGATDSNGAFYATGQVEWDVGATVHAPNHYESRVRRELAADELRSGREWTPMISVRLKRVRAPRALLARIVDGAAMRAIGGDRSGRYILRSSVTLDYKRGTMDRTSSVECSGDMRVDWSMEIASTNAHGLAADYVTRMEFRALNPGDGIVRARPDGNLSGSIGSALVSDYEAPVSGYTNAIVIYRRVQDGKVETNDDQHYLHYFRIRSQLNERGEVTNALYGKIYGPLNGNFRYYLNPTPNDRNVEFDPARNLFEGLGPLERVTMP